MAWYLCIKIYTVLPVHKQQRNAKVPEEVYEMLFAFAIAVPTAILVLNFIVWPLMYRSRMKKAVEQYHALPDDVRGDYIIRTDAGRLFPFVGRRPNPHQWRSGRYGFVVYKDPVWGYCLEGTYSAEPDVGDLAD